MISKEIASLPNNLIYFEKQIVFDLSMLDIIRNPTPKKRTENVNKEISNQYCLSNNKRNTKRDYPKNIC